MLNDMRRRGWAWSAIVLAALASGCAAPFTPPLDVAEIAAEASPYQQDVLEDGRVTPEEYELAVVAFRDCVEAAGAEPGAIVDIGDGEQGFDYEITAASDAEARRIERRADACLLDYYSDIGRVWVSQRGR